MKNKFKQLSEQFEDYKAWYSAPKQAKTYKHFELKEIRLEEAEKHLNMISAFLTWSQQVAPKEKHQIEQKLNQLIRRFEERMEAFSALKLTVEKLQGYEDLTDCRRSG